MVKRADSTGSWTVFDEERFSGTASLHPNLSAAENTGYGSLFDLTASGFSLLGDEANINANTGTYIYLAIAEGA